MPTWHQDDESLKVILTRLGDREPPPALCNALQQLVDETGQVILSNLLVHVGTEEGHTAFDDSATIWTAITAERRNLDSIKETIVRRYHAPVDQFLRRQGLAHEDAEDLSQQVFTTICSDGFLSKVDPKKGRFRSLLLAVTRNVIASFRRRQLADIRDQRKAVVLDAFEIPVPAESDAEFDRLWVKNLMAQSMGRMRKDAATSAFILQLEGRSYQEIARTLKKSETEVTNYIHRAKKRLRTQIERLIRDYSGDDFHQEIASLVKYM